MNYIHKKDFLQLISQLEAIINGLVKHIDSIDLSNITSKNDVEEMMTNLRVKKDALVDTRIEAQKATDEYYKVLRQTQENLSKISRSIRGKLGIRNKILLDFGLEPYKQARKSLPDNNPNIGEGTAPN
ncbi:MAG TPA: hypothetical protein DCY06_10105 [Bacteroidetes bacterium]|nr:hypothetical protein [Bacteroidota bacterium]HRI46947.1 hypothetical protein [Ignavibacteriaceae bacterium]